MFVLNLREKGGGLDVRRSLCGAFFFDHYQSNSRSTLLQENPSSF